MTTEQVKSILTEAATLGCLEVRFTGGEPLLRPDFEELYLFARRLGLKVSIFTNARLITPQLADLLMRIPPLVSIEVSVYGMHKESYEAVSRVPGSFVQFQRGVNLLLERKIPFIVKGALLPPNKDEMDEFEAWAKKISWMDTSPNYAMFFDLRGRRDDKEKNALIATLRLTPQEGVAVLTKNVAKYKKKIKEFAGKFMGSQGDLLFQCGVGEGMCIDAYGYAQPCMGVRAPELTVNLFPKAASGKATAVEHTHTANALNKVFEASRRCMKNKAISDVIVSFKNLHEMKATNPDYLRQCAVCFLKGLCEQCPAKSWAENGTLDTPVEYLCKIAHAQGRFLGWLKNREKAWEVLYWKERVKG
jgi:sulfatase maturation enzyme AslB (radical SAM superfamily)